MRILLSLTIVFCIRLSAQTTFAPIGAKWTYKQGTAFSPDTNLAVLEVINDTLIQGRTCSKLQINQGWFGCHEFVQFFSQSNDSLFYFDPASNEFHLLFRWNALLNETWSTPVLQSGYLDTLDWSVADTGHIILDGVWLRTLDVNVESRQWMLFSYGGTITERLGGFGAPFTWILGFCDGETFLGLRCYEDPDISWLNPQFEQCDQITGVPDIFLSSEFMVSPTVIDRGGTISITSTETVSIELLDATGRVVQHPRTNSALSIDQPGICFVRAISGSRWIGTRRVLVR